MFVDFKMAESAASVSDSHDVPDESSLAEDAQDQDDIPDSEVQAPLIASAEGTERNKENLATPTFICTECNNEKPASEGQTKGRNKRICNACNALHSRIRRLPGAGFEIPRIASLTAEQRVEFANKAAHAVGDDLVKIMKASIVEAEMLKETSRFSQNGDMIEYSIAEEKYKNKPKIWQNILNRAPRQVHPTTGETFLWIATLSIATETSLESSRTVKRGFEGETKIKRAKAKVAPKKTRNIANEDEGGADGEGGDPPAPDKNEIPPGPLARLEQLVPKMQDLQLSILNKMIEIATPEQQQALSPKVKEELQSVKQHVDDIINTLEALLEERRAEKGEVQAFNKWVKETVAEKKAVFAKLKMFIEA